ncbi:hypothetical protein Ocin01_03181, partial [Orchesella cincta]
MIQVSKATAALNRISLSPTEVAWTGTSKIGSACKADKYKEYILPFQRAIFTDTTYSASPEIIKAYAKDKAADPNIDKLLCDSRGLPTNLLTHLQCDETTNTCTCLQIEDLRVNTEQVIGTTGCLAVEDSWCQETTNKLACGFGNQCIANRCTNTRKLASKAAKAISCKQFNW